MAISLTVVGIAVGVAALLLLLLFLRLLVWSREPKKVPLPPVQMLAHDRQRQQEDFMRRKQHQQSLSGRPPELIVPETSTSSSSMLTSAEDNPLDPPNRFCVSAEQTSGSSISVESPKDSSDAPDASQEHAESQLHQPHGIHAKSSLTSLRSPGVPLHSRSSRVEIILPAPLATQRIQPRTPSSLPRPNSLFDQWTPPLSRSTSTSRRSSSSGESSRRSHSNVEMLRVEPPPVPPMPSIYHLSSPSSS